MRLRTPGKPEPLGDPDRASMRPLRERRDDARQPDPVRTLDQHRVARPRASLEPRRARPRRRAHGRNRPAPQALRQAGAISSPTSMRRIDARGDDRLGELGVISRPTASPSSRISPSTAIAPAGLVRRAPRASRASTRDWHCSFRRSPAPRRRRTGDRGARRARRARPSRRAPAPPPEVAARPHRPRPAPPARSTPNASPGCDDA